MSTPTTPETVSTSVLIIGAGGAGLRTSIELAQRGVDCLFLGKRPHGGAHTIWAAGGINASLGSLDPEDRWAIHAADLSVQADRTRRRYERAQNVRFMLTTAETILPGALERSESGGVHARPDYTEKNPSWRQNIRCVPTPEGMGIEFQEPGRPSPSVQRAVDEEHELDYHHLE